MSDPHLPQASDPSGDERQPEVRLELTRAGVQEVLSLYSQEQRHVRDESNFTIRLIDLQKAFAERRRMLVIGTASGIALAVIAIFASSPLYPVSAQVVLERNDVSSRSASLGPGASEGSSFIATQAEIMQSQSVLSAAVNTLPRPPHLDAEEDELADATEAVRASPVSGTQVVALGYLGADPEYGASLLTAIIDAYRGALKTNEVAIQGEKLRSKQAEIDVLETETIKLEGELLAARNANGTLGSAQDSAEAQATQLRDLARQIADVRNERIGLENRLAAGGAQLAILDPATRNLQEQLWAAEAELARVRLTLKERHPAVDTAQQEVSVLRSQLNQSSKATPEALKRDIAALKGLEAQLLLVYEGERVRNSKIENERRAESLLLAELERVRELGDTRRSELLDQRLVTRLAEAGEVGITARLIEPPVLPKTAAWPRPKLMLVAGALVGLLAGFIAAIISLRQQEAQWVAPARETAREVR